MQISKLKVGMSNVLVEGEIIEKGEIKRVETRFGKRLVCNLVIQDETGKINLSLWEKDIDKVKEGDRVKITGGFVISYKGKPQLNVPKKGRVEVIK